MGKIGLLATFLAAVAIVAWDEIKIMQRVPRPERFVKVAVVWGILGFASEIGAPELAALFGLGFVLAMLYTTYNTRNDNSIGQTPETSPATWGPGRY